MASLYNNIRAQKEEEEGGALSLTEYVIYSRQVSVALPTDRMDSNQGQKKDTPPPPFFKVPRLEEAPSVQRSIRTVVLDSPAFQALAFSITKLQQANQEEVKKMSSKKKTSNDVSGSKQPKKR